MSSDLQQLLELFDAKVQSFAAPVAKRFQALIPFKDGIIRLREKNASSRTIAELLKQLGVTVSHNTVARFCRELIAAQPATEKPRSASKPATTPKVPLPTTSVAKEINRRREETKSPEPEAIARGRGPRIADPKNV